MFLTILICLAVPELCFWLLCLVAKLLPKPKKTPWTQQQWEENHRLLEQAEAQRFEEEKWKDAADSFLE